MTEAERIDFLIKVLESGNAADFAERIGVSRATANRMRQGKVGIRLRINDILFAYPAINREWLESGEGYPGDLTIDLVKAHYEAKLKRQEVIIDHLLKTLGERE